MAYIRMCGVRVYLDEQALGADKVRVDPGSIPEPCGECGADILFGGAHVSAFCDRREVWCDSCGSSFEVEEDR